MSRKSRSEYIAEKRKVYNKASHQKRSQILSEVCETLGHTRKYVIKLMTGNICYRVHKGRGKTYTSEVLTTARKTWETIGCPCTTYFVVEMERIVKEYESCVAVIKPQSVRNALLKLSASTLDRAFKGIPRTKIGFTKANHRSGRNRVLYEVIECKSGEETMACNVAPIV